MYVSQEFLVEETAAVDVLENLKAHALDPATATVSKQVLILGTGFILENLLSSLVLDQGTIMSDLLGSGC